MPGETYPRSDTTGKTFFYALSVLHLFQFIFKNHIAIMSPMNEHDIKKIEDFLRKHPVVAVYIFGSEAKGTAGLLSDIDIAVV